MLFSPFSRALFATALLSLQVSGCSETTIGSEERDEISARESWWASRTPDVIIDNDEFHTRNCSIIRVTAKERIRQAETLFTVPAGLLTTCENTRSGEDPLQHDGSFLILSVCQITIGAGGCAGERYRSADFAHWEEYIGVTWIKGEPYEAWRTLGSTSSRADSVKKIED